MAAAMRWVWVVGAVVLVAVGLCDASSALAATPVLTPVPGSPFSTGSTANTSSVAFSLSGRLLGTANGAGSVSVFSVNSTGALTRVEGSPFAVGSTANTSSVAFSPSGRLLAVANNTPGTVSTFAVNSSTGALTPVTGSPFTGQSVAFSPSGGLLAVANPGFFSGSVSVLSVDSSGALTEVTGSPVAAAGGPDSVAFSPSGGLLAVGNGDNGTVSVFSVNSAGGLTPVSGSPFATGGTQPISVAFSPSGGLLAVANAGGVNGPGAVSVFSVNPAGALTPVTGSPFAAGAFPWSVAFSPSGRLLAVADQGANGPGAVSVFSVSSAGALTQVTGSPVAAIPNPQSVAFSPSGRLLAVAHGGSRTVSVFSISDAAAAPPIEASNQITVSHVKAQADGTISFQTKVPGPGRLDVLETAWDDNLAHTASVLQPAARRFASGRARADATRAGVINVQASVNAQGKRLVHHHRYAVTLRLWLTYTPTRGTQSSVGFYGLHLGSGCPDATSSGERTKTNCALS